VGVVYCLKRASAAELAAMQRQPRLIGRFLFDDEEAYPDKLMSGKIGRMFGRSVAAADFDFPEREEIDLDKSWHVLHFLLTGLAGDGEHPLNLIGRDWPPLANVDNGLGPPMGISPSALRAFHEALADVSNEEILARWDSEAIRSAELYLGDTLADDEVTGREYIDENLSLLRKFVSDCQIAGDGAVAYYT
jgi:hypothetical protein